MGPGAAQNARTRRFQRSFLAVRDASAVTAAPGFGSAHGSEVGQQADGRKDEEDDQDVAQRAALLAPLGAPRALEAREGERRDRGELFLGKRAPRVVALHSAIANGRFDELIVMPAM